MNYKLGLYEKSMPEELQVIEKLVEAKEAGFDYLELSIDETDAKLARLDWDKDEISEISKNILLLGVPIKSICLSGHRRFPLGSRDAATRTRCLEILNKAVQLASDLGVSIIQLAGYDVYYEQGGEDTKAYFADNLAKSVEVAAREGIVLAFETMETPFLDTVEKAMSWIKKINSPYLQIYPDIGNLTNASVMYKTNPVEDLKQGSGHVAAVHLKETTPGVYREVPFGHGHVNFSQMAKTAFDLGVRMFVGEFWHVGSRGWREILRQNNLFLRNILDDDKE